MRRIMSRGRRIFWNGVCVVALLILLSMIGSKILTGWSSVLSYKIFFIMSASMEDAIKENEFVIGKILPEDSEPEIGKIYAYRRQGLFGEEIIIHRLISIGEDGNYQFKGDNNELPDERPVEREDIGYVIVVY